jgi:hypothetical protein
LVKKYSSNIWIKYLIFFLIINGGKI